MRLFRKIYFFGASPGSRFAWRRWRFRSHASAAVAFLIARFRPTSSNLEAEIRHEQNESDVQVTNTTSLCSLCQTISVKKMRGPFLDQMQPHQPSYLALKLSAEAGCRLCQFFCVALSRGDGDESAAALAQVSVEYPGRGISLVAWGGAGKNLDRIHVITTGDIPDDGVDGIDDPTMHPNHQIALQGVVQIYTYRDDAAAWHGQVNGRPLPTTPGDSDDDFALIEEWLSQCCSQHSRCRKPRPRTPLPTRVIDVGSPDDKLEPCLLDSKGEHGPYVTLTHCWGGKVPLTTTTGNLKEHERAIPLNSLPKTFRDAVLVTRKLGVRYLWIDSLCILQDSASDWQKESAVMEAVYRNGYLNISARGASNSNVGCFITRAPEPPACRLPWDCSDCAECSLTGSIYVRSPDWKADSVRNSPCDERGWIFQEQLLSPRVLYFGSDQLYWECCETTLRQDGRFDDDALYMYGNFPDLKVALGLSAIPPSTVQLDSSSLKWWTQLVEEYTRRHLTFASDKLPAISGIAKAYQKTTGKSSYVAGIWLEDLPAALTWYNSNREQTDVAEDQPSWSWAKMSGRVRFQATTLPRGAKKDACSVVDVRVRLNDKLNGFDNVAEAEVDLRGHVVKVVYMDAPDILPRIRGNSIFTVNGHPLGRILNDMPASRWPGNGELYCILLQTGYYPSGLVLAPDSGSRDVYRRVGLLIITHDVDDGEISPIDYFLKSDLNTLTVG